MAGPAVGLNAARGPPWGHERRKGATANRELGYFGSQGDFILDLPFGQGRRIPCPGF